MVAASLLSTLLLLALTISITAKPVLEGKSPMKIKLPLTKRYNLANYNVMKRDRRRLNSLRRRAGNQDNLNSIINLPARYKYGVYVVDVGVGLTNFSLILDSASGDIWVGANTSHVYVPTSTSHATGNNMAVGYFTSSFSGFEVIDQVTMAPGFVIPSQSIGVARVSSGFDPQAGIDGILGVGLAQKGTLSLPNGDIIPGTNPTVLDNLYALNLLDKIMAVYFPPFDISKFNTDENDQILGQVSFGGIDTSKYIGEITYIPVTSAYPANQSGGIDASVAYANLPLLLNTTGTLDSGSSAILLATKAFKAYQAATGGVFDEATKLLTITSDQYNNLQNLRFIISGVEIILTPNAQISPRSINRYIGGDDNQIYLSVRDLGTSEGSGVSFIAGVPLLQRYLVVFDYVNMQVGFAKTLFTNATTN